MSILVVGSVAFDSVETPFGRVDNVLGGSATYFSTSASFFTDVNLVAVVGEDFPQEHLDFLKSQEYRPARACPGCQGKTFHWKGRYGYDLNEAQTLETHLNVFETFKPQIPAEYADAEYLFLANIDPELQMEVLDQVQKAARHRLRYHEFLDLLQARGAEKSDRAGRYLHHQRRGGPAACRRGQPGQGGHGSSGHGVEDPDRQARRVRRADVHRGSCFRAPAYPLEEVFDPTGAGDTFAGGFMGYLANTGDISEEGIRQAIIFGSVMASFNVEDFSLDRLKTLNYREIEERYRSFKAMTHFRGLSQEGL